MSGATMPYDKALPAPQGTMWQSSAGIIPIATGLNAVRTTAPQRVTRGPPIPTPVSGQERHRADLRLHAQEERRDLY